MYAKDSIVFFLLFPTVFINVDPLLFTATSSFSSNCLFWEGFPLKHFNTIAEKDFDQRINSSVVDMSL